MPACLRIGLLLATTALGISQDQPQMIWEGEVDGVSILRVRGGQVSWLFDSYRWVSSLPWAKGEAFLVSDLDHQEQHVALSQDPEFLTSKAVALLHSVGTRVVEAREPAAAAEEAKVAGDTGQ